MTNEMPIMQQPLVDPTTPEQQLVAATLPPTANQPAPEAKMPKRKMYVEGVLSDGRKFKTHRAKGRDMQNALRISDSDSDIERGMIISAIVTEIEGMPLSYEDFLDLDLDDCNLISSAFTSLGK